jgi:NAD(P)-dependent dehydrogenase (short-subunit alcohol dehydrogenase family)
MLGSDGRVIMVSGAARGIGRAIVERLLAAGFRVSAGMRRPDAAAGSDALMTHAYEAEDADSPGAWVAATVARFGRLDGLVNAAGINPMANWADADEAPLDLMWRVNVKGPMRLCRAALPHLKAAGAGRIVNVASLSGKRVANSNTGYAISKFAVVALTQALRRDCFDAGIRATALCPGFVDTDMTAGADFPRDQMTRPEDLAALTETLLCLPSNAVVAELLVNCRPETIV